MQIPDPAQFRKPLFNDLAGRFVELPNDTCKCGSVVAVIDRDHHLRCRSCGRPRGFLSKHTADWIIKVIATLGADAITIRGPAL